MMNAINDLTQTHSTKTSYRYDRETL